MAGCKDREKEDGTLLKGVSKGRGDEMTPHWYKGVELKQALLPSCFYIDFIF